MNAMLRVMVDTNILIAGFVLLSKYIQNLVGFIEKNHTLVLPDYIISEFQKTAKRKFPKRYYLTELFLQVFPFETVYVPENFEKEKFPAIRDIKDLPILVSAMIEDIDVLITNDNDFRSLNIDRPEILKPYEFMKKYNNFT